MAECGCDGRCLTASTIGYTLAPRINAAGRMGKVTLASELFLTRDESKARELARRLCALNRQRQEVEAEIYQEALSMLARDGAGNAIVLAGEHWHQGVIGIVASRLAEEFGCPAYLICLDGEKGKASSRSYGGFNLFASLEAQSHLLESYGGHELAAGFTILRSEIDAFRASVERQAAEFVESGQCRAALEVDCAVDPALLTEENILALEQLEPCGAGCPKPVFFLDGLSVEQLSEVGGGRHLRLRLRRDGHCVAAIFFSTTMLRAAVGAGDLVEIAFTPQINEFRGVKSVQLNLVDIRPDRESRQRSGAGRALYDKFTAGQPLTSEEAAALTPDRADFTALWRYLVAQAKANQVQEDISCMSRKLARAGSPMPPGRIRICLDVLEERGLLTKEVVRERSRIRLCAPKGKKVNLGTAPFSKHSKCNAQKAGDEMETAEARYQSLMRAIARHAPTTDIALVDKAYHYAEEKHKKQLRKSGEPYIIHPLAVAEIVVEIGLDTDAILAALLHDCLEDTDASFDELVKLFGRTVAELVEGVTKLTRVNYSTTEEQQMENLRKMFMAMSKDIRVILIKIADRLHNMRTLEYQSGPKQISKSTETMEIYAPIAHRLGMQKLKWELEDLSLQYLDPEGYHQIMDYLAEHKDSDNRFMQGIQMKITERLESVGIHGTIYGRIKHVYSIYRKLKDQHKTIDELYDLYAFRVIVDDIPDCYNVLGHIHDLFNPVPGRFKDYISTPKPNMYQSLHTTVIGTEGIPFEVQIRTWKMHETAEYGVAAHWKYKQGGQGAGEEKEFEWVRRLLESQQDTEAEDYIHSLKVDMFNDEVFVFTPKGKVISLPAGSTPIDFAYAIHSAVGNSMVGAKVNNRIASFDMQLKNGDIVEVLTSKSAKGPSRDWLKICQSNQARIKIKQWFKKEKREENIAHGKASFESELKRMSIDPAVLQNEDVLPTILKKVSFDSLDDMYAAIGYGGMTAVKCVNRIRDELVKASKAVPAKDQTPKPLQAWGKSSRHRQLRRHCRGHRLVPGEVLPVLHPRPRRPHHRLCHQGLWRVHPPL